MKKISPKFKIWIESTFLLMIFLNFSIFFWDFYSGTDTLGYGVVEPYVGMGMFYVYVISYFTSLIVIYAILKSEQFGMGFFVWIPYAVIGFFVEAYFELEVLKSVWGVVGYCLFGLLTGFTADISYKLLKERTKLDEKVVAGLAGVIMSITYFITTIISIGFFYKVGWGAGSFTDPGTFLGVSYFAFPWMVVNAYFGGLTAYAIVFFSQKKKNSSITEI